MLALLLLCLPVTDYPVGGGLTDSTTIVPLPAPPAWAPHATLTLSHRARYRNGWETNLWGQGSCVYASSATISQKWTMVTGNVEVATKPTSSSFAHSGTCVPFDGQMNWAGPSGGMLGPVWVNTYGSAVLPIAELGPCVIVFTDGSSAWDVSIACTPTPPGTVTGALYTLNESWWNGSLSVTYR